MVCVLGSRWYDTSCGIMTSTYRFYSCGKILELEIKLKLSSIMKLYMTIYHRFQTFVSVFRCLSNDAVSTTEIMYLRVRYETAIMNIRKEGLVYHPRKWEELPPLPQSRSSLSQGLGSPACEGVQVTWMSSQVEGAGLIPQ
jgi:hypothetical protein